ncbi:ABC transporter permease [Patescibacteria group bacterium]
MIDVSETVNLATRSIWRNKARSSLTMLGIIIGVSAVILLTSVGQGLQNYITGQFEELGTNLIYVLPGKGLEGFGSGPPNFSGSKLTLEHAEEVGKLGGPIKNAAAVSEIPFVIKYKGESKIATIEGFSEEAMEIMNIDIDKGRKITRSDVEVGKSVVVVGQSVVEDLFGASDPLGQQITIADEKFTIVGVINEIGTQSIGLDINNLAIIPITSSLRIFNNDNVQSLMVQAINKDELEEAIDMVERYLGRQLDEDDFSVIDQSSLLETINQILGVLTAALGGIAAISLVVGGVGIMNIMLVSVTERTREIGLRKAVGAKPSDILNQFLIEAITLSVVGGGIGISIGWGGALLINQFFPAVVTWWSVILAFTVSAIVGITFGVAPAIRASKLDPIDALRYE